MAPSADSTASGGAHENDADHSALPSDENHERTYSTGLPALDGVLGGGVPGGATVLILADASNGPLEFLEQFAAAGLASGDRVYYYGIGRPGPEVRRRMRRYLERGQAVERLEYLDYYGLQFPNRGTAATTLATQLVATVKAPQGTALMYLAKHVHEPRLENRFQHMADGVVDFRTEGSGLQLRSYFRLQKMRGVPLPPRAFEYGLTRHGIRIETTRRV